MDSRSLISLASASVLLLGLTACGSSTDTSDTAVDDAAAQLVNPGDLTVCSDVPYPPFEDFDNAAPSGFSGFDIDVISYVADDLKLNLVVKDSDFDALQSGLALNAGQCDLVASAMTITEAREEKLGFSQAYYDSQQSLLVAADSGITGLEALVGKKVGVQKGSTGEIYARENAADADIVSFPSDAQMYAAIKAGQVDALLQDLPVNLSHESDPEQPGAFVVAETYDTDEAYGFAMKKTNTGLIADVDAALAQMQSSGEYQTVYDAYFTTS
jgi:polar amino acid transport system substrate-binding protein